MARDALWSVPGGDWGRAWRPDRRDGPAQGERELTERWQGSGPPIAATVSNAPALLPSSCAPTKTSREGKYKRFSGVKCNRHCRLNEQTPCSIACRPFRTRLAPPLDLRDSCTSLFGSSARRSARSDYDAATPPGTSGSLPPTLGRAAPGACTPAGAAKLKGAPAGVARWPEASSTA